MDQRMPRWRRCRDELNQGAARARGMDLLRVSGPRSGAEPAAGRPNPPSPAASAPGGKHQVRGTVYVI